jgi:hypothetical protein
MAKNNRAFWLVETAPAVGDTITFASSGYPTSWDLLVHVRCWTAEGLVYDEQHLIDYPFTLDFTVPDPDPDRFVAACRAELLRIKGGSGKRQSLDVLRFSIRGATP